MLHRALTDRVIAGFYTVYDELGHGFLESVYEAALATILRERGADVRRQLRVPVYFGGRAIASFRIDMIVDGAVVVEVKAARAIEPVHSAQVLNYLRATDLEVGLLLNFGRSAEFRRVLFTNDRKLRLPAC
jgi:GxxExxY protein